MVGTDGRDCECFDTRRCMCRGAEVEESKLQARKLTWVECSLRRIVLESNLTYLLSMRLSSFASQPRGSAYTATRKREVQWHRLS